MRLARMHEYRPHRLRTTNDLLCAQSQGLLSGRGKTKHHRSWAPGFRVGPLLDFDIGWAEAVAVELSLHLRLNFAQQCQPAWPLLLSSLGQHRDCISDQQREIAKSRNKQDPQACIPFTSAASNMPKISLCCKSRQHC